MKRRLQLFKLNTQKDSYQIINSKEEVIGYIEKQRVGAYMHWCFIVPKELFEMDNVTEHYYYSAGCMEEIRMFLKNPEKYIENEKN